MRIAQELVFRGAAHLADEFNERARLLQERFDRRPVVLTLLRVDLGRDLERHARAAGDLDGPVDALLRREAAEEGQVLALPFSKSVQVGRQTVVDGRLPIGPADSTPLVVGDGHQRNVHVLGEQRREIVGVQPTM